MLMRVVVWGWVGRERALASSVDLLAFTRRFSPESEAAPTPDLVRADLGPKPPLRYISMSVAVRGGRSDLGELVEASHSAERMLASLSALLALLIMSRAVTLRGLGVQGSLAGGESGLYAVVHSEGLLGIVTEFTGWLTEFWVNPPHVETGRLCRSETYAMSSRRGGAGFRLIEPLELSATEVPPSSLGSYAFPAWRKLVWRVTPTTGNGSSS